MEPLSDDLYIEILEQNIKFKFLLSEFQEEITRPSAKREIFIQLSLLHDILEKKLHLLKNKNKSNSDYLKLKQDTANILRNFKKIKFIDNERKANDYHNSMLQFSDDIDGHFDQNLLVEENLQNILQLPFDKEEEINNLLEELHGISNMSKETGELIMKQTEYLDLIEIEANQSKINTEKVVQELKVSAKETIKKRKNYIKIFFATLGGLIGIQAGPVGVGVGALTGGCIGEVTSLSLNPLQSKIKNINEKK